MDGSPTTSLIAARLRAGDADEALVSVRARQAQLESDVRIRAYWVVEEMKIRALLALGRFADALSGGRRRSSLS